MQGPPIWQRLLAAAAYLLPWSDGSPFGQGLFGLFPILTWLQLPALPVVMVQQVVPFGSLVLFLVLFLAVEIGQRDTILLVSLKTYSPHRVQAVENLVEACWSRGVHEWPRVNPADTSLNAGDDRWSIKHF